MGGGKFSHDEAQVVSQYHDHLKVLDPLQFQRSWDSVINGRNELAREVGRYLTTKQQKALQDLKKILQVGEKVRIRFDATQKGDVSHSQIDLIFSIRTMEYIMGFLNEGMEVRQACKYHLETMIESEDESIFLDETFRDVFGGS